MFLGDKLVGMDLHSEEAEVRGDIYKIPFKDDTFDTALVRHIMEHLNDTLGAVCELKRVLKPGGTILMPSPSNKQKHFKRI